MRLSDDFLSELKYRNDLSEIAAGYMQLKRRGRNLVGLCPFHGEKTPSFNIYTENGSFYCFGCGVGGDVITFIRKIENLDYIEAVRFLAQRAGMTMPEDDVDDSMSRMRTRIYEANREAARFYHAALTGSGGQAALGYLRSRALSDSTIRHFGLGYAPPSRFALADHLRSKGFSESELIAGNLVFRSRSGKGVVDRFADRVMFPIIDLRGNVIAFGGRLMGDGKPKYLNTSDTVVFSKSSNLFSLNNAKNAKSSSLILCEGYMDVISLCQAGFAEAVATLGTALTADQAALMKRYCDDVVICYDADEAGRKATARAIEILRRAGVNVRVLTIPDGKDPDEFLRRHGDKAYEAFKNLLDNTGNDIDYRLYQLRARYDMTSSSGKLGYLSDAVAVLSSLENPLERDIYASKLSDETGVNKASVMEQVDRLMKRRRTDRRRTEFRDIEKRIAARDDRVNPQHADNLRAVRAEENLIAFLVNNPDKLDHITSRITADDFVTDFNRKLFTYFSERIKNGVDPMASVSADFTADELSRVIRIVTSYSFVSSTVDAMNEYIDVILCQSARPSLTDIRDASDDELKKYLQDLKESKK